MPHRALVALAAVLIAGLGAAPARAEWVWPVRGEVITPYRNGDDPYAAGQHRGIDVAAAVGTPVVAAIGGEVRFAGVAGSSGLTVSIRTTDGTYDTSYLHLSATTVGKGDQVTPGERIGAVGTTGVRSATRPHLHFGVREAGTKHAYHDPLAFLPPTPAAPERPRPTPVPGPAPLPVTPDPEAVPVPRRTPHTAPRGAPAPRHRPQPAPRGAPAPRRRPHPLPRRSTVPHGAPLPHAVPAPLGAPLPQRTPARPVGVDRRGPAPRSRPDPALRVPSSQPHLAGRPEPGERVPRGASEPAGPDLGLVLACLGLLAAAAVIGLTGERGGAGEPARRRLAALLAWGR